MLAIGTYVIKSNYGVCRVEDIVQLDPAQEKYYYLLVPASGKVARYYLPTDLDNGRVREVMTREEAWDLMHRIGSIAALTVTAEKTREQTYAQAVGGVSPEALVSLVKYLHNRKAERAKQGKDMISVDRRYYSLVKGLLNNELSFVTGENPEAIEDIFRQALEG